MSYALLSRTSTPEPHLEFGGGALPDR